jgi:hypothetical protein
LFRFGADEFEVRKDVLRLGDANLLVSWVSPEAAPVFELAIEFYTSFLGL